MAWPVFAGLPLNCPYKNDNSFKKFSYLYLDVYPNNLDPILSNEVEKNSIISQIYEPLYTIAYQTKPYRIIPHIAQNMPQLRFLDSHFQQVDAHSEQIAYTVYRMVLQPEIYYQPHPGFCKGLQDCRGFKRELHAEDYAYQIKRIAQPHSNSPYSSVLTKFILGFSTYQQQISGRNGWQDLRQDNISGVKVVDDYTLEITTIGYSNQWIYWMTMSFLSPIPWEIDHYHHLINDTSWIENSIGTGPYMLLGNQSRQYIELKKNPNYREEYFDFSDGRKKIPLIDRYFLFAEKERIPRWNKFLQGYFDSSTIPSESFQNTIQVSPQGHFYLTKDLEKKHIHLAVEQSAYVSGVVFNFLDPIVGGYGNKAQKLRRAIALAFDFDEYRTIFRSGRGQIAHDPLPPIIFPNKEKWIGENLFLYDQQHHKRSLAFARKLLSEAGYPRGIDPKTKRPLVLNFDQVSLGQPEEKALFSWFRKQMAKLGIQLNIRESDMNRYHQKLLHSAHQMTFFIWSADFPNPENFLMLFYGPNHLAETGGANWANFNDKTYNQMYQQLESMNLGPQRNALIQKMIHILQAQGVWIWATYGESFYILQDWMHAEFLQEFSAGLYKYNDLDVHKRQESWQNWNHANAWPLLLGAAIVLIFFLPFIWEWNRRRCATASRQRDVL